MAWGQVEQRVDRGAIAAHLEMKEMYPSRPFTALRQYLAEFDRIALFDQQPTIETVCAEIVFVVFDDDKVAVTPQSTATVGNLTGTRRAYHLAWLAPDPKPLVGGIAGAESLNDRPRKRPGPDHGGGPCPTARRDTDCRSPLPRAAP